MNFINYVFCLKNFFELTSNLYVNSKNNVLSSNLVPEYQFRETFNIVRKHQRLLRELEDIWPSTILYLVRCFLKDIVDLQYLLDFVDKKLCNYYEYLLNHYQQIFQQFLDNE